MFEIFRTFVKSDGRIREGKWVNLRNLIARDYKVISRWFKDLELMEYAFGIIDDDHVIKRISAEYYKDLVNCSSSAYAIETKGGLLIGFIRFSIRKDSIPYGKIGIIIGEKEYRNKGYGTEALTLSMQVLFKEKDLSRIELDTAIFNTRAQRCFAKCGFKKMGELTEVNFITGEVAHKVWMRITKEEFFKSYQKD